MVTCRFHQPPVPNEGKVVITKKVYDVFDTSKMVEPYKTDVQSPMSRCRAHYEQNGWKLVEINDDYSIWSKENPEQWEIDMVEIMKESEEEMAI